MSKARFEFRWRDQFALDPDTAQPSTMRRFQQKARKSPIPNKSANANLLWLDAVNACLNI
jgi:hypothetical protein